jgi:hypothetical protein
MGTSQPLEYMTALTLAARICPACLTLYTLAKPPLPIGLLSTRTILLGCTCSSANVDSNLLRAVTLSIELSAEQLSSLADQESITVDACVDMLLLLLLLFDVLALLYTLLSLRLLSACA